MKLPEAYTLPDGTTITLSGCTVLLRPVILPDNKFPDDEDIKRLDLKITVLINDLSERFRKANKMEKLWLRDRIHGSTVALLGGVNPDEIRREILGHNAPPHSKGPREIGLAAPGSVGVARGRHFAAVAWCLCRYPCRHHHTQVKRGDHPDLNFKVLDGVRLLRDNVSPAGAKEYHVYVGSSVSDVKNRVQTHIREMNRPAGEKRCPDVVHYVEFGNDRDVIPNFRLPAAWSSDEDSRFPVFCEGLLITYLGLQLNGRDSDNHPLVTFEFNRELRQGLDLPDFMGISLNRAWPLWKGIGFQQNQTACANPTCRSLYSSNFWHACS